MSTQVQENDHQVLSADTVLNALSQLSASERLALIQEAEAQDKAIREQAAKERAEQIALLLAAGTAALENFSIEYLERAKALNVEVEVVFDATDTKMYCLEVKRPPQNIQTRRNRQISTSLSANQAAGSEATVDGEVYRSYREASDSLGYARSLHNGHEVSRNDRTFLASQGHLVGPPTR